MFGEELSLQQWVNRSFPGGLTEVIDPNLVTDLATCVKESSSAPIYKKQDLIEELLVSIIHVAFLCLKESPEDRIDMRGIVGHLKKIRTGFGFSTK